MVTRRNVAGRREGFYGEIKERIQIEEGYLEVNGEGDQLEDGVERTVERRVKKVRLTSPCNVLLFCAFNLLVR